jgi:dienelactone hydrolase
MYAPSVLRALVASLLLASCAAPPTPIVPIPPPATLLPAGAERVRFPSRDAALTHAAPTVLDAVLFRPPGAGPFPAIVALHGCAGPYTRDGHLSARDGEWALRLRDQGYVVLLPDSFDPRGLPETCSRKDPAVRAGYERPRDAYGALVYLQSLPFVRADRVALLGWSNGAIATLTAVATSTQARPPGLAHDFRVAVAFYPGCSKTLERADWRPAMPLHIFIGASDDWTPAAPCVALVNRAQAAGDPVTITVYPGAFHDFDAPDMPVHQKHGVATTASGEATLGTNPAARADAIARVPAIFGEALR